jgi:hypothetical protein
MLDTIKQLFIFIVGSIIVTVIVNGFHSERLQENLSTPTTKAVATTSSYIPNREIIKTPETSVTPTIIIASSQGMQDKYLFAIRRVRVWEDKKALESYVKALEEGNSTVQILKDNK